MAQHINADEFLDGLERDARATGEAVRSIGEAHAPGVLGALPEGGGWSVLQVLGHLWRAGDLYYPRMRWLIGRGAPASVAYRPGWFARWFIGSASPAGQRKLPAPGKFKPATALDASMVVQFVSQQDVLIGLIRDARGVGLNGPKFPTPVTPLLRFTLGEALELMVRHQQRHLGQIERLLAGRSAV